MFLRRIVESDHAQYFHLLLTPAAEVPLRTSLQLIKGGFSLSREAGNTFRF
jgi:hypothetical protein